MTLEEAIKYQEADKSGVVFNQQARQLGIEAMKRVKANRQGPRVVVYKELPGETEGEK